MKKLSLSFYDGIYWLFSRPNISLRNISVATLENVLDNGGVDALIYLCNKIHGFELHALATSSLAALSEHRKPLFIF